MQNGNAVVWIAAIGIFAAVVWFSRLVGVDLSTGGEILLRLVAVAGVSFTLQQLVGLSLFDHLPALAAGAVWAFFPALDHYSAKATGAIDFGVQLSEAVWYSRWYAKAAFVGLPLVGGYWLRHRLNR